MSRFILKGVDSVLLIQNSTPKDLYHDVAVSAPGITAGSLTIEGKKVGSDAYEAIPDGVIDLVAKTSVQFTGGVESYRFTLAGVAGSGDITVTDISQRA